MKTESEKQGEAARQAMTLVMLGPDGKERTRIEGVAGFLVGVIAFNGEMTVDGNMPPEAAAGVIELLRTKYVVAPFITALQRQTQPRILRATPGVNGTPRIVPE